MPRGFTELSLTICVVVFYRYTSHNNYQIKILTQIAKKPTCDGGRPVVLCPWIFQKLSMLSKILQRILQLLQRFLSMSQKNIYYYIPFINFTIYLDSTPTAFPTTKKVAVSSSATSKSDNNIFTELKEQVGKNLIKIISRL